MRWLVEIRAIASRTLAAAARATAQSLFIVMGAVFGLAFTVAPPPFQVPDENSHFFRAFQLIPCEDAL
jgi:hypothetical protein